MWFLGVYWGASMECNQHSTRLRICQVEVAKDLRVFFLRIVMGNVQVFLWRRCEHLADQAANATFLLITPARHLRSSGVAGASFLCPVQHTIYTIQPRATPHSESAL
jgi:hypothetical protein